MKQQVTITRFSPVSLKENTMTMMLDPSDLAKWERREDLIQNALPYLSPAEREFLISGVMPGEWDLLWGTGEED